MVTMYQTPRGVQYDPLVVEVWDSDGDGPVGRIEQPERLEVTWALKGAGTCVLEAAWSPLTDKLTPSDGRYLLVVHFNGMRHVGIPVTAEIYAKEDAPHDPRIKVVTASAWSMLDRQHIPPVPDKPITQQESAEFYELTAPVETVVKRLIEIGSERLGHPIVVTPDAGRGPERTIKTRFDRTGELVEEALMGSGYHLRLEAWLPGDPPLDGLTVPTAPVIYAHVEPYRQVEGLVWTSESMDVGAWEYRDPEQKQPTCVVVRGEKVEGRPQRFYDFGRRPRRSWQAREVVIDQKDEEQPHETAGKALSEDLSDPSLEVELSPSLSWEFGVDGGYPRQYRIGDYAEVRVPGLRVHRQVITEVVVELTPVSLTVTPKVGSPDTKR